MVLMKFLTDLLLFLLSRFEEKFKDLVPKLFFRGTVVANDLRVKYLKKN